MGRRVRTILLALLALTQLGCAAMLRHRPVLRETPGATRSVVELQEQMNPWLLTDLLAETLIVEIDWVEGLPPSPKALRALEETLRKYGPPGRGLEIKLSDEIPRGDWEQLHGEGTGMRRLVQRYLDSDPRPSPEHALAYVLYVPYLETPKRRLFGRRTSWLVERDGVPALVDGVMIFRESISKRKLLWITGDRIDRAVLVHEFGHLFGLVSNPRHGVAGNPQHCTEVYCTMTPPGTRGYLANFVPGFFAARIPTDYCKKCRADIAAVQEYWAGRAKEDPRYAEQLAERYHDRLAGTLYWKWQRDRVDSALSQLERAAEAYPAQPVYKMNLGMVAARDGDRGRARELIFAAADGGSGEQRLRGARQLCGLGDYPAALRLLTSTDAAPLQMADAGGRSELAALRRWAHEGMGEPGRALVEMERLAPEDRRTRAHLLSALGRWDEAEALIESTPDARDRPLRLGRLARKRGDDRLADKLFEGARDTTLRRLESIPAPGSVADRLRRAMSLVELAEIHAELADEAAARAALKPLAELLTGNNAPIASMTRARVLTLLGDLDGAVEALAELTLPMYAEQDPCIVFAGTALAKEPRFRERYPWCGSVR